MRRVALACGLGVTLATSGCLGGGGNGGSSASNSPRKGAQAANRVPHIAGSVPPEAAIGEHFDFRPSGGDPDGDVLVYSISNQPAWAHFNAETGRLHGRPGAGDVGIYTGIVITASDGRQSAALAAFDLSVVQSASGNVTLSWEPPTRNDDGTALRDLAGYRIYVGRRPDALSRVIVLNNPGLTRFVIENLARGRWHFAMTSFNRDGRESRRTGTVSKRVG